jgi:Outer membrane efflux protein
MSGPSIPLSESRLPRAHGLLLTVAILAVTFAAGLGAFWLCTYFGTSEAERYNAASQFVSQVGGGVSINVPWLNGKKYRAEEREAQSELRAAESDFISAQTQSLGLLRNQLEKIETLHHHLELYSDNLLPTARQTVNSYQTDYEGDQSTRSYRLAAGISSSWTKGMENYNRPLFR